MQTPNQERGENAMGKKQVRGLVVLIGITLVTVFFVAGGKAENQSTQNKNQTHPVNQLPIPRPTQALASSKVETFGNCLSAPVSGYALDMFNAINNERTGNGMPALAASGCVTYVAQIRSNDMASRGYFSHVSPDGSTAFTLMNQYEVPYGWAGENLARNNYPDGVTVEIAIRDLMASSGHRANILNILGANYTSIGVAVANDGEGKKYFTVIFIGPP